MNVIGKIENLYLYEKLSDNILTDEVILTEKQIKHIIERRGEKFYNEYFPLFLDILNNPDYIFRDNKPSTALVSKTIASDGKNINIVLKLAVKGEHKNYKNSIITVIKENDSRFAQRLRNNQDKLIYSKSIDKKE